MGEYNRLNAMLEMEQLRLEEAKVNGACSEDIADISQGIGEIEGALLELAYMDGLEDPYMAFDY